MFYMKQACIKKAENLQAGGKTGVPENCPKKDKIQKGDPQCDQKTIRICKQKYQKHPRAPESVPNYSTRCSSIQISPGHSDLLRPAGTDVQRKSHTIEDRIVSIHQPHVRPIVRGKTNAKVEFGAKINVSLMNGFEFLEDLSWNAFNEGTRLLKTIEQYKARFGYYPKEVLADKIYCNRTNRSRLKELQIVLVAKALGRPRALSNHIRPGQRNPIEGKFGQAKSAYGLNRIKARLQETSSSWIATIIMVLNLVKLTGQVPFCLIATVLELKKSIRKFLIFLCSPKLAI